MQYPIQVFLTTCNCTEYVAMFMISRTAAITCVFHHTASPSFSGQPILHRTAFQLTFSVQWFYKFIWSIVRHPLFYCFCVVKPWHLCNWYVPCLWFLQAWYVKQLACIILLCVFETYCKTPLCMPDTFCSYKSWCLGIHFQLTTPLGQTVESVAPVNVIQGF